MIQIKIITIIHLIIKFNFMNLKINNGMKIIGIKINMNNK